MKIKDIVLISALASILFVSEQILTILPNIQITFLLIIVYSKVLKYKKTLIIILIHVLLDNLFMGTFNIIFIPFMFIGYSIIPISLNFIKAEDELKLSFLSTLFSMIYCMLFVIPNSLFLGINLFDYLLADIPYILILSLSSFLTVLWLYKPIKNKLEELIKK